MAVYFLDQIKLHEDYLSVSTVGGNIVELGWDNNWFLIVYVLPDLVIQTGTLAQQEVFLPRI
jgi:hypothetical protein